MSSAMRLLLPAALSVTLAARVAAQDGHQHRGFWIGSGLGGGVSLDYLLDGESFGGGGGYLRLGGTPSQKVLLGLEGMAWGRDLGGSLLGHGRASFVVLFYPSRHGSCSSKAAWVSEAISSQRPSKTPTATPRRPPPLRPHWASVGTCDWAAIYISRPTSIF